jgi:hypothetical protein
MRPAQRVKLLTRVAAFYHQTLLNVPEGLRYLTKVRGLRDVASFKTFQIGFANGSLLDILPQDRETIAQLKDRIARTIELLRGFSENDLAGAESREVVLKIRDQVHTYQGLQYLSHVALPNFFFHATTAYDILRHNGVELGKRDFIGSV